jgi:uncharacterized protein YjbI with pentapeptide repeats
VAIDAKDLGELQKALNEAAGKASVLWTTFIIFQFYLAIAFGSVTHRDLFLETPIKLPLLNVDLPLVGFFAVASTVLLIFHFYVFLQLFGLASKAKNYNTLLTNVPDESDRQYIRQRLDVFPILQFLAGPRDQRTGFVGFSLRLIAWITLVATPVLILLQAQVTFLPYHRAWIVWLQRVTVLIDLALIWYFWIHLRSVDDPIKGVWRKAWIYLGGAGTLCVVIFSTYLATFPGEWMKTHLPEPSELQALLFEGNVDRMRGRPQSVFSNRLVLTNQSFIVDPEKLVTHSFRGRDLRLAVLNFSDLRKADFSGAQLQGARLSGELQGASFLGAQLQGADLIGALQGASLTGAQLQGARLSGELQGASLIRAQLQGADLSGAQLQGADLSEAQLQGASLHRAELQGARLSGAQLQGAWLVNVLVWRASGTPNLYLADFPDIDIHQKPWKDDETFGEWRDAIANSVPAGPLRARVIEQLAVLDPTGKKESKDLLDQRYWERAHSSKPQGEEFWGKRAMFLADLACSGRGRLADLWWGDSTPYVARGVLQNLQSREFKEFLDAGARKLFTDRLLEGKSDSTACPGVRGFTDTDWADLSKLTLTSP